MSGKPAARLGDPTACPSSGHGTNAIATGSADVLFDGRAAARQGDTSACGGALAGNVIPTVLINGRPATTVGTVGSHGNVVVAGSGSVLIGAQGGHSSPQRTPTSLLSRTVTAVVNTLTPGNSAGEQTPQALDYRLQLAPGGNRIITPLQIPDYAELSSGITKNRETIDFLISNRQQAADSLILEVRDGSTLIYSETDTARLLPNGQHLWQWDGYDLAGVLDTQVLKSPALTVRLDAIKGSQRQTVELKLDNRAAEVKWADTRIDRSAKTVLVTIRPSFSDGGVKGAVAGVTPVTYPEIEALAKRGIEHYWSRNGTRGQGIGNPVSTSKGEYRVTVIADLNVAPCAPNFPLTENMTPAGGRSTSFSLFKNIHHNFGYRLGYYSGLPVSSAAYYARLDADDHFMETAAHEFGHLILNEYGGGVIPTYSWQHKNTSTLMQTPKPEHDLHDAGEVDLMHYFTDDVETVPNQKKWVRTAAAPEDVLGLIWLTRVNIDD